ncbi:MAG: nucleotide pyrophosphohydrolase [Candidatus Marinimicrobia bacterium]|nr:nucleotide pyrophosphohydrolase [Candidatus Neomarinimicrobiota bacterium]
MTNQINDGRTSVQELKTIVEEFIQAREWEQFHSPKNLSMALAVEAAELMNIFKWQASEAAWEALNDDKVRQDVEDELADIFVYALAFANRHNIDISSAIRSKMLKNGEKYPQEKFKGRY